MRILKFGYAMENGNPVVQKEEAKKLIMLYEAYLEEPSLVKAGRKANLSCAHPTIKRYLTDDTYLGIESYPKIIDKELFDAVQEKLQKKKRAPKKKGETPVYVPAHFRLNIEAEIEEIGLARAETLYERIEEIHE